MHKILLKSSFIRFLLVGFVNTFAGLSIIFLAKWFWRLDDIRANLLGYGIGISVSFILNKRWTFSHAGPTGAALARFLLIVAIAYSANLVTVIVCLRELSLNGYMAQTMGVVSYTAIGYLGSRLFVFMEPERSFHWVLHSMISPIRKTVIQSRPAALTGIRRIGHGKLWIVVLGFLIAGSYGAVWTRGGYADDFALVAVFNQGSLVEGLRVWLTDFNSRVLNAITISFFYRLLDGAGHPGDFNWTAIHAIGIASLAVVAWLFDRLMVIFHVDLRIRLLALAIFLLHPIKAEALLWPCTELIYVFPLAVFLAGTGWYLERAAAGRETLNTIAVCFFAWMYSILSVEQFVPLTAVVVGIRLTALPRSKADVSRGAVLLAGLALVFLASIWLAGTADRLGRHGIKGGFSLAHVQNVALTILSNLFIDPLKTSLDPAVWHLYYLPSQGLLFAIGAIAIGAMAFFLVFMRQESSGPGTKAVFPVLVAGVILCIAPLLPFFVIGYYIPKRVFFIPVLGFSLAASGLALGMIDRVSGKALKITATIALALPLWVFFAGNVFAQREFSDYWDMERALIAELEQHPPAPNSTIHVYGLPKLPGPVPNLFNDFALQGLITWMFPGDSVRANALSDLSDVMALPLAPALATSGSFTPKEGDRVLLWARHRWNILDGMLLEPESDHNPKSWSPYIAGFDALPTHTVRPVAAYLSNSLDTLLLCVSFADRLPPRDSLRVVVHVQYRDGLKLAYDETVALRPEGNGTDPRHRCFVIADGTSIQKIALSDEDGFKAGRNLVEVSFQPPPSFKVAVK